MKTDEAIEMLRAMQNKVVDYAEMVGAPDFAYGCKYVYPEPEDYAIEEAITALKEVQQYREIGTVKEFREAMEKQKAKETIRISGRYPYKCPTCNGKLEIGYRHCIICGQLLRYLYENLEGMEDETD